MGLKSLNSLLTVLHAVIAIASPTPAPVFDSDLNARALSPYAPISAQCPGDPLVRPATSLGAQEASYVSSRNSKASSSLASWLNKCGSFSSSSLPTVAFASSGGGYRALLETAGVVQGFDIRDSNLGTGGVYQGLTYQSGLSGGSWFLSSLAGNNWPTVSSLKIGLWEDAFQNSLLVPPILLSAAGLTVYAQVVEDIGTKQAAGYDTTIVDPYGRLLSYQLLYGDDGGAGVRLSGLTSLSNFTSFNVPYPIITTTIDFPAKGQCYPTLDGPIFEFHPYEYGSWDKGVSAFAQTQYMGTDMNRGKPVDPSHCTQNYDNIGYIFGTSSDVFNGVCGTITPSNGSTDVPGVLEGIVAKTHAPTANDQFGLYRNPFYHYRSSSMVRGAQQLKLSDGGEALQNVPV